MPEAGKNGIGEPECVYCPLPVFSDQALRSKQQARIMLRIVVTEAGQVSLVKIVKAGRSGLTQAAIETVRKWTFKPALYNGKPVAVSVEIKVLFRLL